MLPEKEAIIEILCKIVYFIYLFLELVNPNDDYWQMMINKLFNCQ